MDACGEILCSGSARHNPVIGVFTLFTLFTLFFDGTERQYECKKWLVVKVQSLRSDLWLKYSTNVLF